jgi:hypothetical protein
VSALVEGTPAARGTLTGMVARRETSVGSAAYAPVLGRWTAARRRLVRQRLIVVPLAVGLLAFAVSSGVFVWGTHDRPVLRMEVSFDREACCAWQVWVGGVPTGELTVLPLNPGTTTVYTVPLNRSRVDRLFVPVGTQAGGSVMVRRIWVTRGSRTVAEVTPDQLRHATVYQGRGRPTAKGLEISGTGSQPSFDAAVSLDTHEGRLRLLVAKIVSQRLVSESLFVVFGSALVALLALEWRRRWLIAAALLVTALVVRGLPSLSYRLHFHDDISRAVGYSSYVGVWKARERFIQELAGVVPVMIAVVVGLVYRHRQRDSHPAEDATPAPISRALPRGVPALLVAVPVAVVTLLAAPNLRLYIGPPSQLVPSWDANNFIFWQYLVQKTTLEPVKDFYWLYGFQWLVDKPVPWGLLVSYCWFLSFWLFLALGTYLALRRFFTGRSLVSRYLILTSLWLTAVITSDMPFPTRYIAPLAAVLLFAGIDGARDRWWSWRRALFALALVDTALFEPAQAGYALVPIAFLVLAEFWTEIRSATGRRLAWMGRTATTIVLPLGAALSVLLLTGTATQTASLYDALTFSSSAYAFPSQVDTWVTHPTTLASSIFWAVPLTLVLGLTGLFVQRGRPRLNYAVVTALGLLGFMIMQKQILRPGIESQVWLPLVFGLAYWVTTDVLLAPSRHRPLLLALCGAAAALVLVSGGYRQGWAAVRGGPARIGDSMHALIHQRGTFAAQEREQFTAPVFARFTEDWPVVHALQAVQAVRQGRPVWILGDDSPITMMLGRSWPYYFNDMYDASPISFQKKLLSRLAKYPPARVVWNFAPHAMIFDQVPMPVRVPLLYTWAVRNLIPAREIGTFEILRPRHGEPVALAFWRNRIGARLDLGHVPAVAKVRGEPCVAGPKCATYVEVRFPPGTPRPPQVIVPVTVGGLPFEVAFEPGRESRYVVPLDRVWFWAGGSGSARRVDTTSTAGAEITLVTRTRNDDILY